MARHGLSGGVVHIQTILLSLVAYVLPLARCQLLFEKMCRRLWGTALRTIRVDELTWVYLDNARDKETVVLVHGFGADKYRWGGLLGALSHRFRVISPDLPGFGATDRPNRGFGVQDQTQRLVRFLDKIGVAKCHLVGTSMGGLICCHLAAAHPDRVDRMVLMAPANFMAPEPSLAVKLFLCEGRNLFLYRNEQEFMELLTALYHCPPWISPPLARYLFRLGLEERPLRLKILNDLLTDGVDGLEGRLARIQARTLMLWGESDHIFHRSAAPEMVKRMPRATMQMIPNCGHIPFLEAPGETKKHTIEFLSNSHFRGMP